MSHRSLFLMMALCLVLVSCSGPSSEPTIGEAERTAVPNSEAGRSKSNVIWIVFDALRAQNLSCYGYSRDTSPTMSRLASQGVLFEQHFTQHTQTYMSVPQYLTGRYYPVAAFTTWSWNLTWRQRPNNEKYISEILGSNGYDTALFTPHPFFAPEDRIWRSFDHVSFLWPDTPQWNSEVEAAADPIAPSDPGNVLGTPVHFDRVGEAAIEWISQRGEKPFFAYLHTIDTHFPHDPMPPFDTWVKEKNVTATHIRGPKVGEYTTEDQEIFRGLYDGSLAYADDQLLIFLDQLKSIGALDNTYIVLGSDHGEALGEDGINVGHSAELRSDELLHIPLIIWGPGIPKGDRISALTENVDIVPTLIDLLGLTTDAEFQGRSLVPLLRGEVPENWRDHTFTTFPGTPPYGFVLRTSRDKYVRESMDMERPPLMWYCPDLLADRRGIEEGSGELSEASRARFDRDIGPVFQSWRDLPTTEEQVFRQRIRPRNIITPGVSVSGGTGHSNDNKWLITPSGLISFTPTEDSPPIMLRFHVPNAKYRVQAELSTRPAPGGAEGFVGSSLRIKTNQDEEFRILEFEKNTLIGRHFDLGVYDISDGKFEVMLDEGNRQMFATLKSFRFVPSGIGEVLTLEEDDDQREDQLRALGYLE